MSAALAGMGQFKEGMGNVQTGLPSAVATVLLLWIKRSIRLMVTALLAVVTSELSLSLYRSFMALVCKVPAFTKGGCHTEVRSVVKMSGPPK